MQTKRDFGSNLLNQINISRKQWISFGLAFFITWSIAFFLWINANADKSILFYLNNSNFSERVAFPINSFSDYGMPVILLVYLCYLILSFKIISLKNDKHIFLLVIYSFVIAGITGDVLKVIFYRSRPIVEYGNAIRSLTHSGTPSFPSGHATRTVALVLPFLFYTEYKSRLHTMVKCMLAFIAIMVCFSRIFLGAHYLSDVLAGVGLVFLCLPVTVMFSNKIVKKLSIEKFEFALKIWIFLYIILIYILIKI